MIGRVIEILVRKKTGCRENGGYSDNGNFRKYVNCHGRFCARRIRGLKGYDFDLGFNALDFFLNGVDIEGVYRKGERGKVYGCVMRGRKRVKMVLNFKCAIRAV